MKLLTDFHNMTVLEGVKPKQRLLPATELGRSLEARGADSCSTGQPVEGGGLEDCNPVVRGETTLGSNLADTWDQKGAG